MLEITGRYNTARVFAETIGSETEAQIRSMCDLPFLSDSRIRIMPDTHAGRGCTVGTTLTIGKRVVPNMVGVDIGCGMETVLLAEKRMNLPALDSFIRARIPAGMRVRESPHAFAGDIALRELRCYRQIREDYALRSLGTLGGGNHFIEVDRDEEGQFYLIIHSGSRRLGNEVAQHYQQEGYRAMLHSARHQFDELAQELLAQGREREIEDRLRQERLLAAPVSKELAYVEGELLDDYLHDMQIVQQFAALNRRAIAREILRGMKWKETDRFTTVHNYIDREKGVLRKGAISAQTGERMLIPINMRDGSLLCVGKGNEDWNCSAPHGAGRLYSRGEARNRFTVSEFRRQMEGVYTTSVCAGTLDECPMSYKGMEEILRNITPTAEVTGILRPVYNFKAAE